MWTWQVGHRASCNAANGSAIRQKKPWAETLKINRTWNIIRPFIGSHNADWNYVCTRTMSVIRKTEQSFMLVVVIVVSVLVTLGTIEILFRLRRNENAAPA